MGRDVGNLKISGPGYNVEANEEDPVHGMNAGKMIYEHMHRGYGTPVVLGEEYTITGDMHDDMILELSDNVLASYFGHSEGVSVRVGQNSCTLQASDDKSFISPRGLPDYVQVRPTHSTIQAGNLKCADAYPTPPSTPPPTRSPTPSPTPEPTVPTPELPWCPEPTPTPAPSPAPPPTNSDSNFIPHPCGAESEWKSQMMYASGLSFEGERIRTDGGVRVCSDCDQRCFLQAQDTCVGFIFEFEGSGDPFSSSSYGSCTYFSRIDRTISSAGALPVTTEDQIPARR